MKKIAHLLVILFPLALVLVSCEMAKELELNPLAKQVSGLWWSLSEQNGTLPENFGGGDYTRVGQAINLNFSKAYSEYAEYYDKLSVVYMNGHLVAGTDDAIVILEKAGESLAAKISEWDLSFNGGASADNYNINDEDFTPSTWRDQEAIYIYDGTGTDVVDAKGRSGYTLVNMPWYQGDVLTNLPDGFCDDITPGNGWEWVLNRCGSRAIVNNNFFAVYNKYSGILRFFYYLPYGFNAGNDHVWQVSMTDHLAQQAVWRYGLPSDKTITDKAAMGQTGNGTFVDYVTPWVDYMSPDGLITPNAGWWAFDVDLSQTRTDDIQSTDNIKLQMRSWNISHISLASTVAANIDGRMAASFDLTKTSVSSAKGITESFSDIKNIGTGIFNTVKSAMSGKWMDAIKAGIGIAKDGYTLYGARKDSQLQNDALRSAFGAGGKTTRQFAKPGALYQYQIDCRYRVTPFKMEENSILADFLLDFDDKCGMQQSYEIFSKNDHYFDDYSWTEYIRGRGADGYAIEPLYLSGMRYDTYMPFLEVCVTVMVKLKGPDRPIVLSRSYLPEIRTFNLKEFNNARNKTRPYADKMTGHTKLHDYQMARIDSIISYYDIDGFKGLTATAGTGNSFRENYHKLFDGDSETKWCTTETKDGVFFVEFQSNVPIIPTKYYLTTAIDTRTYPGRNPMSWKLMAKVNEEDAWTTIATVTDDSRLPADSIQRIEYNLDVTGKKWEYFRFEISKLVSGDTVQLAEFAFGLAEFAFGIE